MNRHAFALIELLCAVVILAIMVSIVASCLPASIAASRRAACVARVRSTIDAAIAENQDRREWLFVNGLSCWPAWDVPRPVCAANGQGATWLLDDGYTAARMWRLNQVFVIIAEPDMFHGERVPLNGFSDGRVDFR